jgi:hypothetical protein
MGLHRRENCERVRAMAQERDQAAGHEAEQVAEAAARGAAQPAAIALQQAIGNRAMAQALQRMEATEAVEPLEKALATGTVGAERVVLDTLTTFSADPTNYDKVAIEYEKKVEKPLQPAIDALTGETGERAQGTAPPGFFKGISGEEYPAPKT